jgi:hypothetical protein
MLQQTQTTEATSWFDESPTEVRRAPLMPPGNYNVVIKSLRYDKSSQKGTEFVEFSGIPTATDADEADIERIGGLEGKVLRVQFYNTEFSVGRLDKFHQHCGIDLSVPMTSRLRNEECINRECCFVVRHEPARDGSEEMFAKVTRTLPPI